jgi:hypothetical protein
MNNYFEELPFLPDQSEGKNEFTKEIKTVDNCFQMKKYMNCLKTQTYSSCKYILEDYIKANQSNTNTYSLK